MTVVYPGAPRAAVRGFSLKMNPGEKVGVCGRTGAGKSSLTLALFGVVNPKTLKTLKTPKP